MRYPAQVPDRIPKAPAEAKARATLEVLRNSWMLALRADGKSKRTLKTYRESADQFVRFLVAPPPLLDEIAYLVESAPPVTGARDITATHIRAFITHLQQMHKPATANNRYRGLQQWFRWMVSEEEIEYSPFAKLNPPTVPEEPVPVVPTQDIKAVLATCKGRTFVNLRDEAIIRLFCDTGVRVSEMAGLMKEPRDDQRGPHVDMEQQMIWVLGKGRRYRAVPFGPKTGLSLDRYLRERRKHKISWKPELWLDKYGRGPLSAGGIEQMVARRARLAGVPRIHPHQYRHTWAHQYRKSGGDRGDLKRLGGWKSDQMVDRYGASAADERAQQDYRKRSFGDQI
jgi:site-specific recombinase XerD